MTDIYRTINENYDRLSDAEQEIVDFILKYEEIEKLKLKIIREHLFVSNATIIRAVKKLNCDTFTELKYALITAKKLNQTLQSSQVDDFSLILEMMKGDFLATIDLVDQELLTRICQEILEARRIFCLGTGSSSQVASDLNRKLKLINLWSNDYIDYFSMERIPEIVNQEDVLIVFSLSGNVEDLNEMLLKAKGKGARIIAITSLAASPLKRISTHALHVYNSTHTRTKLRSRLMLYLMSTILYEKLLLQQTTSRE
ncbi:MurR/RpiR family transcriptional regulator [Streptococcus oralis]|uniref:Sialic acid utilization regulator, RpiR family n=1 Tax=Streptococcus oralis TaxID=1303 RepID=A0A139P8Q1_STROR|nr:MurR/RpiR family transcriptional regulator [Streptococcus oralis]KXT84749.1 Sialic acid utilization regulator, RpiR family [Streptococcus oralis]